MKRPDNIENYLSTVKTGTWFSFTDSKEGTSFLYAFCSLRFLASIGKSKIIVYSFSDTTKTQRRIDRPNEAKYMANFCLNLKSSFDDKFN